MLDRLLGGSICQIRQANDCKCKREKLPIAVQLTDLLWAFRIQSTSPVPAVPGLLNLSAWWTLIIQLLKSEVFFPLSAHESRLIAYFTFSSLKLAQRKRTEKKNKKISIGPSVNARERCHPKVISAHYPLIIAQLIKFAFTLNGRQAAARRKQWNAMLGALVLNWIITYTVSCAFNCIQWGINKRLLCCLQAA